MGEELALIHQRCGTRLLLERDRAAALEHYLAARALGLDAEGLGFGATLLADEAVAWIDRGIGQREAGDLAAARASFEEALRLDPASLEAQNHLGVARFELGDPRGAAELAGDELLPEPVHLNLARAWDLAGEPARARRALAAYLEREPDGAWSEATRRRLAELDASRTDPRTGDPGGER